MDSLAAATADELKSVIHNPSVDQGCDVLLHGLDTAGKGDYERVLDCARDRAGERGERRRLQ